LYHDLGISTLQRLLPEVVMNKKLTNLIIAVITL
jgi:hypothetical protein